MNQYRQYQYILFYYTQIESMLSNIIETKSRLVDKYNIQFTYYEFQSSKFIEIKVYEYELLLLFKVIINEIFINKYKPDISNVKQLYDVLTTQAIEIKKENNNNYEIMQQLKCLLREILKEFSNA